jgi:hypothetical protein
MLGGQNMKRYRVYVGHNTANGQPVSLDQWIRVEDIFLSVFEGFSRFTIAGGWIGPNKEEVRETSYCYEAITYEPLRASAARDIAVGIRMETQQAAVLYTIEEVQGGFV